ncbi:MAG: hypothetical protein IT303_10685 [Dehalococcoidia bacterium]|nr:hypothetical protein [Dehalococcoidia bacterium]
MASELDLAVVIPCSKTKRSCPAPLATVAELLHDRAAAHSRLAPWATPARDLYLGRQHRAMVRAVDAFRKARSATSPRTVTEVLPERTRDEQYAWLCERVDPASPLARQVLDAMYNAQFPLPTSAETQPHPDVAVQADFFYERDGVPGVCIFVDGAVHHDPGVAAEDARKREALEDRGFIPFAITGLGGLGERLEQLHKLLS